MDSKKTYYKKSETNIVNKELCNRIREKLKLKKFQLPDRDIIKICKINNKLLGDWIINNADGFKIKDNGVIIVSKYLPKCLRGDKQERIESIMNNPKLTDQVKEMYIKRYTKSLEYYKKFTAEGKSYHVNLHSFFYLYRIIWFNSKNCTFDKAPAYEVKTTIDIRQKLSKKIIEGKEYYEWQFSDFRETKKRDREERKILKEKKKKCQQNIT